jgi:hypothetical protein
MTESLKQEQLRRIEREVVKAIPDAEKAHSGYEEGMLTLSKMEYMVWWMQSCNAETATEIERLIEIIIEEQ